MASAASLGSGFAFDLVFLRASVVNIVCDKAAMWDMLQLVQVSEARPHSLKAAARHWSAPGSLFADRHRRRLSAERVA